MMRDAFCGPGRPTSQVPRSARCKARLALALALASQSSALQALDTKETAFRTQAPSITRDCDAAARLVERAKFDALESIPPRSRVMLRTFGDSTRQRLGSAIQRNLEAMGYDVIRVIALKPPAELQQELSIRHDEFGVELLLAPAQVCAPPF